MSIFGAVCMFLLTALSSLNANDMGTRKTKNVGLNSDYSEQEQVGRPGLRKAVSSFCINFKNFNVNIQRSIKFMEKKAFQHYKIKTKI